MLHFSHSLPPWGGGTIGARGHTQDPDGDWLLSTPVLFLLHLGVSFRTGCCEERGSMVPGREGSQKLDGSGRDRPDPPVWLLCVTEPGWHEVSDK